MHNLLRILLCCCLTTSALAQEYKFDHITLESGQLHLEPEGAGGSEPLVAGSETVFYFCCQDLTWEFVTDAEGRTAGIQIQGQPQTLGRRVE